jgi:hypothetical protein
MFVQEAPEPFLHTCVIARTTERPRAVNDFPLQGRRQLVPHVEHGRTPTRKDA